MRSPESFVACCCSLLIYAIKWLNYCLIHQFECLDAADSTTWWFFSIGCSEWRLEGGGGEEEEIKGYRTCGTVHWARQGWHLE